jgi:hypothetical protein
MDVKIDVSEKTSRALHSALTAPAGERMRALTDLLAAALEDGYLAGVKGVMAEMGPIAELIRAKRVIEAGYDANEKDDETDPKGD